MWYLWINSAAGEFEITGSPDQFDSYFNLAGEYVSEEAAHEAVQQIKSKSTVYAVFFDNAANAGFVAEEHALSGNWRGSKHHPYRCVAEFNTEEEAEAHLAALLS